MKKRMVFLLVLLLLVLGACNRMEVAEEYGEAQQAELQEEMPVIVFMFDKSYPDDSDGCISFIDNSGNQYYANDSYINGLTWKEIYTEFSEGKLNDKLVLGNSCETDKVYEMYRLLKTVVQNEELELIPENEMEPDVYTYDLAWRGFCFDENGNLKLVTLQREIRYTKYRANDENANAICKWFDEVAGTGQ